MSERLSSRSLRLIAYVNSQVALGVPAEEINKAIMSRPIAELEAEAEAKAAAAAASAAGATAPSGTPSTPPTLPASPPLGTPPTLPPLPPSGNATLSGAPLTPPALPPSGNTTLNSIPSGTPPTLPAPPASPPSGNATLSGTPPTPPALPPSGTPGSSSFNNWYEEIQVSGLSNSTPSNVQAPAPVLESDHEQRPSLPLNVTNLIHLNTTASNNEELFQDAKDLGYILLHSNANIVEFNNITNSTSINMNEDEQKLPSLPLNGTNLINLNTTASNNEEHFKDAEDLGYILLHSNANIFESNNITNSTNVTTLSETPSGNTTLNSIPSGAPLTPPGSSFFNNWYEEIEVSGLSNSTPSEVQAPTLNSTSAPSKIETLGNSTDDSYNITKDEQKLPSLPLNTSDHKLFFQSYSLIPQLITTTRIDEYLVDNTTLDNNITPNESPYNINYGQSKSTCLDRINYIDDMKKDDLLYAAKCFNSQFNSSQECMIKSFDIQYNHSSPNHELLSCDIYKGLINLGCKWVSKACESIENINSIDTELCYETIDARNDKIPEITGWHIEIKCDDQTACNAGKKQVTQIALCGSIEDNNYTDNIYSSYDE